VNLSLSSFRKRAVARYSHLLPRHNIDVIQRNAGLYDIGPISQFTTWLSVPCSARPAHHETQPWCQITSVTEVMPALCNWPIRYDSIYRYRNDIYDYRILLKRLLSWK